MGSDWSCIKRETRAGGEDTHGIKCVSMPGSGEGTGGVKQNGKGAAESSIYSRSLQEYMAFSETP